MGSRTAILCLGLCVLGLSASAVQAETVARSAWRAPI